MTVAAIRCSRSPTAQRLSRTTRPSHCAVVTLQSFAHFSNGPSNSFPLVRPKNPHLHSGRPVPIPSALFLFQASRSRSEPLPLPERPVPHSEHPFPVALPRAASPLSRAVHSGSSPHIPRSPFHPENPSHCMSGALIPPPVRNTLSRLRMFFITKEAKVDFALPSTAECR